MQGLVYQQEMRKGEYKKSYVILSEQELMMYRPKKSFREFNIIIRIRDKGV